jgi:hypothetical protein
MADASHEHDALPSYGQNGRDLILKVTSLPGVMASVAPIVKPRPHNPGGFTTRHCLDVRELQLDEMLSRSYIAHRLPVNSSPRPARRPGSGVLSHSHSPTSMMILTVQRCQLGIGQSSRTTHAPRFRVL